MVLNLQWIVTMVVALLIGKLGPRRRRAHRDDLKDFIIETLEFDDSLKPEDYLE